MSTLTFEDRVCTCGRTWSALTFWADDATCDACGRVEYAKRLEAANADPRFTVSEIGGAMPTQAQGVYENGQPYYFRARHGSWVLHLGVAGGPTDYEDWFGEGVIVADGDDPTHGCMADEDVLAILAANAPTAPENPAHRPTSTEEK